jgi:tRNA modification GTPase
MNGDTIAAIATPPGRGGVGIVRVSGPKASLIAEKIVGVVPKPRQAKYAHFHASDGTSIDDGIALYFPAPNSFTGEDVLEFQGHGGPVVMDMLLSAIFDAGARPARPGEFSERAFLNDKIDLAQAEAIADLIDSSTHEAARSALRSLQGAFSSLVHELDEQIVQLRMYVEAALDFPDEEIDFLEDESVTKRINSIDQQLKTIFKQARQGSLLREGMNLVLVGKPNAGKSSLMNALSGRETAIVTHIPGTTRDILRESIHIDGMPIHITDTAGLRDSDDPVEQEGIRRAWLAIEQADLMILLIDDTQGRDDETLAIISQLPETLRVIEVHNKIDLTGRAEGLNEEIFGISAQNGSGIESLRVLIKQHMGYEGVGEGQFLARRRHLQALEQAHQHVHAAREQLEVFHAGELMAEELKQAHDALGEITGKMTPDDLLGEIFSSFCIGK